MTQDPKSALRHAVSRRSFMKYSGGCAALSSASALATLLQLKTMNSAVAAQANGDFKALVCIFLHGGIDSYNVVCPLEQQEYADYRTIRSNLALNYDPNDPDNDDVHEIIDGTSGRKFGMHHGLPKLAQLFRDGKMSFVANVGSLIERTDMDSYRARRNLPLGLYSHADMIRHWQTSVPQSRTQLTGWAGRMADILTDRVNANATISMNIALNNVNIFETGDTVVPYVIQSNGATKLYGYQGGWKPDRVLTDATDQILAETYRNLLEKTHAGNRRSAIDAAIDFNNATGDVTLNTPFPNTGFANQLKMVAKTIGARQKLNQERQVFFVQRGGWDHHAGLIGRQNQMLPEVDGALAAFYESLVELGVQSDVVTFTSSDFARTLSSNGRGSDHAWGGNHMVIGDAVLGGRFFGQYPTSLAAGNSLDTGRGRLVPTTSVDEYAAELALWYGVSNGELDTILPNIRNFYSGSGSPIGFLG